MSTLTATPASQQTGKPVQLKYTASQGGSLRITRPDGSRYYLTTSTGDGSRTYTPTKTGGYKADLFSRKLKVLASTTFAVTAIPVPVPVTPPPPANAVRIAPEDGSFTLPRAGQVWYGVATGWATRQFAAGTFPCTNGTFGDPIPNKVKACYAVLAPLVLSGVAGPKYVDLAWTE